MQALALSAVLATTAVAAPHPFYQSMLQRGVAQTQEGRYADAIRSLRIAAFGSLDDLGAYQMAQVHLAIAHEKLGHTDEARLAATKFIQAERLQASYEQLALNDTTRESFEKIVAAAVDPQYLSQVPAFRRSMPKTAGAVATRGNTVPVQQPPAAQPEKKPETSVPPPQPKGNGGKPVAGVNEAVPARGHAPSAITLTAAPNSTMQPVAKPAVTTTAATQSANGPSKPATSQPMATSPIPTPAPTQSANAQTKPAAAASTQNAATQPITKPASTTPAPMQSANAQPTGAQTKPATSPSTQTASVPSVATPASTTPAPMQSANAQPTGAQTKPATSPSTQIAIAQPIAKPASTTPASTQSANAQPTGAQTKPATSPSMQTASVPSVAKPASTTPAPMQSANAQPTSAQTKPATSPSTQTATAPPVAKPASTTPAPMQSANAQPVITAARPQPAPAQQQPASARVATAAQQQPAEVTLRLTDAQRLLNEGKLLGARNAYIALSQRRDVARAQLLEIARGLNRTGAWQESAMIYQRALPLLQGEEMHMFYEAVNRYELGELTLARTLLAKALPSLPQSREVEAYRVKIQGAS